MFQLYELIKDKGFDPKVSDKSWKIKFEGKVERKDIEIEELEEVKGLEEFEETKEEVKAEAKNV